MFGTISELPLSPIQVAMFVAYMDRPGHARTTVHTYVSAMSHPHKIVDMGDPNTKFWLKKVVSLLNTTEVEP